MADIAALKQIAETGVYGRGKVDGIVIDGFTAAVVLDLYEALNEKNRAKIEELPMKKVLIVLGKLMDKGAIKWRIGSA